MRRELSATLERDTEKRGKKGKRGGGASRDAKQAGTNIGLKARIGRKRGESERERKDDARAQARSVGKSFENIPFNVRD